MKTYEVTTRVMAEPMTEDEARKRYLTNARGMKKRDGYRVEYPTPWGKWFTCWMPKDEFEKAYMPADNAKERLVIEHKQLHERYLKLDAVIREKRFLDDVGMEHYRLLCLQHYAMMQYRETLELRMYLMGFHAEDVLLITPETALVDEDRTQLAKEYESEHEAEEELSPRTVKEWDEWMKTHKRYETKEDLH